MLDVPEDGAVGERHAFLQSSSARGMLNEGRAIGRIFREEM